MPNFRLRVERKLFTEVLVLQIQDSYVDDRTSITEPFWRDAQIEDFPLIFNLEPAK